MTNHPPDELLKKLFSEVTGTHPEITSFLDTGSGSGRKYYRLSKGSVSYIGVANPNTAENESFIYLTRHFLSHDLPVPEIIAVNPDNKLYLLQDLGDITLYSVLTSEDNCDREALLKKALDNLLLFQIKAMSGLDFKRCYPGVDFNRQAGLWDLNYFKYMFLKPLLTDINEYMLEKEFTGILDLLFADYYAGFMYRDFQSRNIMLYNNGLWFIDYQGGRRGPMAYDPASLLYQTRISLSKELRQKLVKYYCDMFDDYIPSGASGLQQKIHGFALLRLLQTLGAYGFRGLFERKEAFVKPVCPAIINTLEVIDSMPRKHKPSYISDLLEEVLPVFKRENQNNDTLTVTINSFSYMHGLPDDDSGNGGGFIFDCRSLPNPYHDVHLRKYSGRDKVIIDWLDSKPEVSGFLDHCESLAGNTIENYLKRGFTNLQLNFGCTGGKHRSVYCAEKLCGRLKKQYGNIIVKTVHRQMTGK